MNIEKLRNRVYDLVKEAEDMVGTYREVQLLTVVARMAETAEHIYEQAARLDLELRACRQILADAKTDQVQA